MFLLFKFMPFMCISVFVFTQTVRESKMLMKLEITNFIPWLAISFFLVGGKNSISRSIECKLLS